MTKMLVVHAVPSSNVNFLLNVKFPVVYVILQ